MPNILLLGRVFKPKKRSIKKTTIVISFDKRQKFVIGVVLLSFSFFLSQFQFSQFGLIFSVIIAIISDLFLFWAVSENLPKFRQSYMSYSIFILPFFFTLAFGLFYFLIPARLLFRILLTIIYAVGIYSLYLCQNIFIVGHAKTIQLISGAKIVSFVLTILTFFFFTNTIFTMHLNILFIAPIIFLYTFLLVFQSVWTYAMQTQSLNLLPLWSVSLSLCIVQASVLIWFWPSNPTIISLFLSGFFYSIVGLSHVWFDRRLFRGVLWEYVWVGAIVFFVLVAMTSWGK